MLKKPLLYNKNELHSIIHYLKFLLCFTQMHSVLSEKEICLKLVHKKLVNNLLIKSKNR